MYLYGTHVALVSSTAHVPIARLYNYVTVALVSSSMLPYGYTVHQHTYGIPY